MRYRAVDVRIWCDKKFRALSPISPCGQGLFLYLLTNPNTNAIPGLYRAGMAAMAEELGWTNEGFIQALNEIIAQGLVKVDLDARVVFIPNAIKFNKPQSPNVVRSWALHWDEIPECDLKNTAYAMLKAFIEGLGEAFSKAFSEAINKAKPNQEQDQEQDQDTDQKVTSSLQEGAVSNADDNKDNICKSQNNCPHDEIIALYHEILPMCPQIRIWSKKRRGYLQQRWRESAKHQTLDWWRGYFQHVKKSDFLIGKVQAQNGRQPFLADLEWLIRPDNFIKVIEGRYT